MVRLAMSLELHYFYLLGEESSYESAWDGLAGRLGLFPSSSGEPPEGAGGMNWCAGIIGGPDCARLASGGNACLCLYTRGHMALIALLVKAVSAARALEAVDGERKALEEKGDFSSLIGESTIIEDGAGLEAAFPAQALSKASLPGAGQFLVITVETESHRRLYLAGNGVSLKAAGEAISEADALLYQAERQRDYYHEQINTFAETRDGLDRKVAETLFRKANAPDELEKEIETLSGIYGVMANYNLMLREAKEQIEADLKGLEKYLPGGLDPEDDFFIRKSGDLKVFCGDFLNRRHGDFALSLESARAAIEVVKGRIELARSRENVSLQERIKDLMKQNVLLQEESLIIGIAASFIEFFIVIYYGLHVWEALAGRNFSGVPVFLKGGLISVLSLIVAVGTHKSAKAIKEKNIKSVAVWIAAAAAVMAMITAVTIFYGHGAPTGGPFR